MFCNRLEPLLSAAPYYKQCQLNSFILYFNYRFSTFQQKFLHPFSFIIVSIIVKYLLVERKGIIHVIVHKDSSAADVLKSFVHAMVMANLMDKSKSLHSDSQMWIDNQYGIFIQKVLP